MLRNKDSFGYYLKNKDNLGYYLKNKDCLNVGNYLMNIEDSCYKKPKDLFTCFYLMDPVNQSELRYLDSEV